MSGKLDKKSMLLYNKIIEREEEMKKIISYKFKCKKIKSHIEKELLLQTSIVRSVWNKFVEINVNKLSKGEKYLPFNYKNYTFLRDNLEECKWWKQGAANFTNYMLHSEKDIFKPFVTKEGLLKDNLFLSKGANKRKKNNPNYKVKITDYKGFPQFHSYKNRCSLKGDLSGGGFKLDLINSRIHFSKVGGKDDYISFIKHRKIEGTPKTVGIKKEGKYWYVNIQCELEVSDVKHESQKMVGVDRGVKILATCSDGTVYESMNFLRKSEKKLAFLQRKLAKQVKGSARWKDTQERIRKLHAHIANSRINYLHHVSKDLTDKYAYIAIEDLKVKNMSSSAKGDSVDHGKNVNAKAGLNKSILDQGWGYLKQQLEYKSEWKGGYVEVVDPKYTSQRCSVCGHVSKDNRQSQSKFVCEVCGHTENADINAAKNILADGKAVTAQGGIQVTEPMNCETEVIRVQVEAKEDIQLATDVKESQLVACD